MPRLHGPAFVHHHPRAPQMVHRQKTRIAQRRLRLGAVFGGQFAGPAVNVQSGVAPGSLRHPVPVSIIAIRRCGSRPRVGHRHLPIFPIIGDPPGAHQRLVA